MTDAPNLIFVIALPVVLGALGVGISFLVYAAMKTRRSGEAKKGS